MDIIGLIIGALIGVVSSLLTTIITSCFTQIGKVNVFYRILPGQISPNHKWGFVQMSDKKGFEVPIRFEIHNTSNAVKIIRDLSIYLYQDNEKVLKMKQIEHIGDGEKRINYGDKNTNAYSFLLEPRSIQNQHCEYVCKFESNEQMEFNKIVLQYYDGKNKLRQTVIKELKGNDEFVIDEEWNIAKFKRVKHKKQI